MSSEERQALFAEWTRGSPTQDRGMVVGCDARQEWMLPWWWGHYSAHNDYPVLFINFGMSPKAADWCKAHGQCIDFDLSLDFFVPQEKIPSELQQVWRENFAMKDFWQLRPRWYKKTFAMLKSPFRRNIWTDLDCEVRGDLTSLFDTCLNEAGLAIAPEPKYSNDEAIKVGLLKAGEVNYNAGVVVYAHGSETMLRWAESIVDMNGQFPGDQDVLSYLIRHEHLPVYELPQIYNWRMAQGPNPEAVIIHWVADWGKQHIKKEMILGKI